jgi:hypothetical protein
MYVIALLNTGIVANFEIWLLSGKASPFKKPTENDIKEEKKVTIRR